VSAARPPREEKPESEVFLSEVARRRARREADRRDASFWAVVGSMGTVGWSVVLPMAAGALFGRWLDGRLDSAPVFLLFFLLVGLGLGALLAWRTVVEKLSGR